MPAGVGAQVFVDVSESIRGFTSERSVALATLHGPVIEASLSALQVNNPFRRCAVDEDVHCDVPLDVPRLRLPATYHGANSALHRVLRRPPRAPRADLQAPDPLDPWAVTVIVTDGFESSRAPFQPDAPGAVACTAGADPSCLAALLRARVLEGYGVWVGRVMLPFDGRYFAERRLDDAMWSRVQAHAAALDTDPAWNGVRFTASAPSMQGEAGAFRWQGARPLLVFVLSRDVAQGRRLVAEMDRRLRVERLGPRTPTADVSFSEWAPFDGLSATLLGAARAESGGEADDVLVDRPATNAGVFEVPVRCGLHGHATVRLDGALAQGVLAPPAFATVSLRWRAAVASPWFALPTQPLRPVPGPFEALAVVDCRALPAGVRDAAFSLHGEWRVDPSALARQWFVAESADTSFESPEKVFGLADLAGAVVAAGVDRRGDLVRASLHLTRR